MTGPLVTGDMQSLILEQLNWVIHHWSAVLVGGGGIIKIVGQIRKLPDVMAARYGEKVKPYVDSSIAAHELVDQQRDAVQLSRIEELKISNAARHQVLHDDVGAIKTEMVGMKNTLDQISNALFSGSRISQSHGDD